LKSMVNGGTVVTSVLAAEERAIVLTNTAATTFNLWDIDNACPPEFPAAGHFPLVDTGRNRSFFGHYRDPGGAAIGALMSTRP
jgi:hypothetical protein